MIALLLALQVAAAPTPAPAAPPPPAEPAFTLEGTPFGALAKQTLPAQGCAAYLFVNAGKRTLAAVAQPTQLRVTVDGSTLDLAAAGTSGAGDLGFAGVTEYRREGVNAVLDLTIERRKDLAQGAVVPAATLRLDRPGMDSVVLPVAGIIGCAA